MGNASVRITFITEPGRQAGPIPAEATRKCVKVVIGDAFVDVWRLHNPRLAKAWSEHNPSGISSRPDQIARLQARAY